MSLEDEFRQALPSEAELIATDVRIAYEGGIGAVPQKCPTKAQWMLFVAGSYSDAQAATIAEHLAECESCTAILEEIRSQHKVADRRALARNRLIFAAIAAVLVSWVLVIWLSRSRPPSETVLVDLRNVTRGVDTSSDSAVALRRNARDFRILLAPQPVEGRYEVAVFNPTDRSSPVVASAASSTRDSDSLVLKAPLVVSNLQPGPYLLGIRHDNSEWVYYAIRIE